MTRLLKLHRQLLPFSKIGFKRTKHLKRVKTTMAYIDLYTIVSKTDIATLKETGYIPFQSEDEYEARMDRWMLQQMHKRLPANDMAICNGPHWCFYYPEDCFPLLTRDFVVLKLKVPQRMVLCFDDNDWVQVTNNVTNNDIATYLAYSQKEAEDNANATKEEIQQSWERMFDLSLHAKRDSKYCGYIQLRAVIPYITMNMIIAISSS